jgi:hypothetical protein
MNVLEFYREKNKYYASVLSAIAPNVGEVVNINGVDYEIVKRTYALDYVEAAQADRKFVVALAIKEIKK